jgi:ferredoxin-nitrite reductase
VVAADTGAAKKPQKVVDAVDVFVGGKAGPASRTPLKILENVPHDELPRVLEQLIPYLKT